MPHAMPLADICHTGAPIDFMNGGPARPLCLVAGARKIFKLISR
jgi:hypothetical protein